MAIGATYISYKKDLGLSPITIALDEHQTGPTVWFHQTALGIFLDLQMSQGGKNKHHAMSQSDTDKF